jgi:hypothetical protein
MKAKIAYLISSAALIAGLAVSPAALASITSDVAKTLAGSTPLELPAKAANLVAQASAADKENVTVAVVKAAIGINPSAAVAIVSTVARENRTVAPIAAVTAATLQRNRIDQIAKAAAAAAPSEAAKIVTALIREFPQGYGVIAIAAAEGAPTAAREILAVVADFVPALQSGIQNATASFAGNKGTLPVQAILSQSYNQALSSGTAVKFQVPATSISQNDNLVLALNNGGASSTAKASTASALSPTTPTTTTVRPTLSPPTLGPPYQPIPSGVTNIGPGPITIQQPGGRNYAPP